MIKVYQDIDVETFSQDYRITIENKCPYCKTNLLLITCGNLTEKTFCQIRWCSECDKFFAQKEEFDSKNGGISYKTVQLKVTQELTNALDKRKEDSSFLELIKKNK